MIETGRLIAYLAAEAGLFLAPGPSVVYVVGAGVTAGRRAALTAVAGNSAGLVAQLVVVAAVLGGVHDSTTLLEVLKLIGAGWLIYLGLRALVRSRTSAPTGPPASPPEPAPEPEPQPAVSDLTRLRESFVVGVTNPKGIVTFTALAPSAVHRAHGQIDADVILLGVMAVAVAVLCDGAWALASGAPRAWLGGGHRRALDLAAGALMVAFGLGLAIYTLA